MTFHGDTTARRRAQLATIHVQAKRLNMDDDSYRALLQRVGGHRSAGDMDFKQRVAVLDELRRLGGQSSGANKAARYPGRPHNFDARAMPGMITKIEAQLADMGLSWAYADAIAMRQCGIARCAWVRDEKQLRGIVAALHVEQEKRSANAYIDDATRQLGLSDKQLVELTAKLPKNWRRDRRCLKNVCDQMAARLEMLAQKESAA